MIDKTLSAVSVLTAGLGSVCCIGPLVASALGVGLFGAATLLEALRPYILIAAAAFLTTAFYLTYRKQPAEQCADGSCTVMPPKRTQKRLLWLITAAAVLLAAFPYYSGVFWASADSSATSQFPAATSTGTYSQALFALKGMTCAGCAASVQAALEQQPGVASAEVNFDDKTARVEYDASRVSINQLVAAVQNLGFTAMPQS